MHNIGEGTLAIPEDWHNSTVNIYTAQPPGAPGISLTVNRDRLPLGTTVDDYCASQTAKLAQQLKNYRLVREEKKISIDGKPGAFLEFTWKSDEAGDVHQMLLTVADGQAVLNFAGTAAGAMSDIQKSEMIKMLLSFKFTPAATA
jgi:hypothetical protein